MGIGYPRWVVAMGTYGYGYGSRSQYLHITQTHSLYPWYPGDMGGNQSILHYYNLILPVLLLVLLSRVLVVLVLMVVCSRVIALIVVHAGTGCLQRTH